MSLEGQTDCNKQSKKQSSVPVAVSFVWTIETSAGRETQEVKISIARTSIPMVETTVRTGEAGRLSIWVLNTTIQTAQPCIAQFYAVVT